METPISDETAAAFTALASVINKIEPGNGVRDELSAAVMHLIDTRIADASKHTCAGAIALLGESFSRAQVDDLVLRIGDGGGGLPHQWSGPTKKDCRDMSMSTASLGITVDTEEVKAATIALDELAETAQRAHDALQQLGVSLVIMTTGGEAEGPEDGDLN